MNSCFRLRSILNEGAGPDGLFPKVLKAHISLVRARVFNLSLQPAQVPEDWRRAMRTPADDNVARGMFFLP